MVLFCILSNVKFCRSFVLFLLIRFLHCRSSNSLFIAKYHLSGSGPFIEELHKKLEKKNTGKRYVKTRYRSYDFIVNDCPQLRRAFVSSRKKWNVANYAPITLISKIMLRSPIEINFNSSPLTNNCN